MLAVNLGETRNVIDLTPNKYRAIIHDSVSDTSLI